MKISALRLFNVRRFADCGVAIEGIGDGVNVFCAANEFGKSTSFDALHALFFQPYSGTPGDVQRLRPYSGGNPLIEADISTAEGRFRITKQYYGGKFARVTDLTTKQLVAQADEAENFIAKLIRGGRAEPTGLLWVRQGTTGFEKRSKTEEDGEKQVRVSLLESVQGEVEAITGGRRMAEIRAATEGALSELVTATGKIKSGGRYATACTERDSLASVEQKYSNEVAALREALDKRTSAMKQVVELDNAEDLLEQQKAIEVTQAAFDAAKLQDEKLKVAESELRVAQGLQSAADKESITFRTALATAKDLRERLQKATQCQSEAVGKRREVVDAIEKAKADAEAAEIVERETQDRLDLLEAALRAREASDHLVKMQGQLRAAEAARQSLEEGEAELALEKIPSKAIDELQALEVELAGLRVVREAARPSVVITYEKDATNTVTMDGSPLTGGEERGYDEQARLAVQGVGTITLRSNQPDRTDNRLEQAEARRNMLLASMGVNDLAAARRRQVRAQQLESELSELRGRLSLLVPEGLPKLREEIAAHGSVEAETVELTEDPTQVRAVLAEAKGQREKTKLVLREVTPRQANADEAFVVAETTLASLQAEQVHIEAILGPEDARGERETTLSNTLDKLNQALTEAETHVDELRLTTIDLESASAALKRAQSVAKATREEISTLRETIAGLNAEISVQSDEAVEEKWRETVEAYSVAKVRAEAFEKEAAVLQRLFLALDDARSEARELYLKPVMTELKPLLGLLFDDVSVTFDDKTLLPQKIMRNGQEEDVDRLSGGMREQLSVLTRLAFARLLARDGRSAPVILDDALVYSDDDRIEKMFDALHRQANGQQIIVFSCRQRAFQKLGGNILRMTDWQP